MDITPVIARDRQLITGYGGGGFKINHQYIAGSLLVLPAMSMAWNVSSDTPLAVSHFSKILEQTSGIELLLVGTGSVMKPLDISVTTALKQAGIAVETMDTGAACRTFNVLLGEERKVAAALIAV